MRRRKWILVLAIVISCLFLSVYFGWRITGIDEKLRSVLLEKVKPFLANDSDIERVEMDLVSLHLKGVRLAPKDRSYTVEIDDVRLGYRLWNLLRYGFVPHKVTHQVVLTRPKVIFHYFSISEKNNFEEKNIIDIRQVLEELQPLQKITLADAEIILEDTLKQQIQLTHGLNGWIQTSPVDSAVVRLTGRFFGAEKENVDIHGKIDLLNVKPVRFKVMIQRSPISTKFSFLVPEFVDVISGYMKGEGTYDRRHGASGFYEIEEGALDFRNANLYLDDVYVRSDITDSEIKLSGRVGSFNGSPLVLSGHISNFLNPEYDLKVFCDNFNVSSFLEYAYPKGKFYISGNSQFGFQVTGSRKDPRIVGHLDAKGLSGYGLSFVQFNADLDMYQDILTIKGEGTEKNGMQLHLMGQRDFSDLGKHTRIEMDLHGQRLPLLPTWTHQNIESYSAHMAIQSNGDPDSLQGEATGFISILSKEGLQRRYTPSMSIQKNTINVKIGSNESFAMLGNGQFPFTQNAIWRFNIMGLQDFFVPFAGKNLRQMIYGLNVNGSVLKEKGAWQLTFLGEDTEPLSSRKRFEIQFDLGSYQHDVRSFQFRSFHQTQEKPPLSFLASGMVSNKGILLEKCHFGEGCSITGFYPLQSDQQLKGFLKFENFSIGQLHGLLPETMNYAGLIAGEIEMSGYRHIPNWHVDLSCKDGYFHSNGPYKGKISFQGDKYLLNSFGIRLDKDQEPVLSGNVYRFEGDSLTGTIQGDSINFGDLILAFTGKKNIVQGIGSLNVHFKGTNRYPSLYGSLAIHNGVLRSVGFRELWADFEDELSDSSGFFGGLFRIKGGWLERDDGLTIRTWGEIPHQRNSDADISILAKGNILSILPETTGFIKKAKGSGELFFRWAGKMGDWTLGEGNFHLDGGEIELSSIIKKVKNIQADISLQVENRFVQINHLEGNIDGAKLIIENEMSNGERPVDPLIFPQLGIHLGRIKIKTESKGVRIHVPGLMDPGERGLIGFSGLNGYPFFTLDGPNEAPLFQGTLSLADTRLTYPFLKLSNIKSDDPLMRFVEKVHWNLNVIPVQDTHYIRDVESPLGNVYADLKLRDHFGGLRVQGISQEGTLQVWGNLISTEGTIEVLDHYFRPEQITFDYPKGATNPILSARAHTTLIDSTGIPANVWLTVSALDTETGLEHEEGDWANLHFRFTTDNPNIGRTEADLLAALGYSVENMRDRAYDAIGMQVDNWVFRPLLRPIERGLRRHLGLDVVRFSSMFSRNLVQLRNVNELDFDPRILFRSSKVMLGKYVAPGFFITYSGQVQNGLGFQYLTHGLGFRHALTMEYSIQPDLFLEMEYTYDSQLLSDRREDKRIWIRHIFPF